MRFAASVVLQEFAQQHALAERLFPLLGYNDQKEGWGLFAALCGIDDIAGPRVLFIILTLHRV